MVRVLFICHGNICRSPMAEFMFKDMLKKRNINDVYVYSSATSTEELGNNIYYKTIEIFNKYNIPYTDHYANKFNPKDYDYYDYILCMDDYNIRNLNLIRKDDKNKYHKLRYLIDNNNISDPWYTRDFERTYKDILESLEEFIKLFV